MSGRGNVPRPSRAPPGRGAVGSCHLQIPVATARSPWTNTWLPGRAFRQPSSLMFAPIENYYQKLDNQFWSNFGTAAYLSSDDRTAGPCASYLGLSQVLPRVPLAFRREARRSGSLLLSATQPASSEYIPAVAMLDPLLGGRHV
jgi:hypothetical protein